MQSALSRRAVVTGFGCVTALGKNASDSWKALLDGKSARGPITAIATEGCRVTDGAQAALPPLSGFSHKQLSRLSRASRLAIPAVEEALTMADLLDEKGSSKFPRLEISVSTTACGMEKGELFLHTLWQDNPHGRMGQVAHYQAQQQVAEIHRHFRFTGPSMIVANACAGGGNAIGHAADLIHAGMADIILAGGYDALCELVFTGFDSLHALAPEMCRPFDRGRNGLMVGEGAAFLVIESEAHAIKRGATIQGVVAGYGQTTDTFHLTQPSQDGLPLVNAMQQALAHARLEAADIGYVNAHGTGTPFNDGAEAKAFRHVFGSAPTKLSSTKAGLGHTLGAAGSIEAVLCLLALNTGSLPPQINLLDPEPLVAEALVKAHETADLNAVMSLNLGFGGSNAALIFTKP